MWLKTGSSDELVLGRRDMFLREPSHILLIILVLVLLFGAKRLPESARALGRSLRIFKGELKDPNKTSDQTSEDNKKLDNPDKSE